MTRLFGGHAKMPFSRFALASVFSAGLLVTPATASNYADTLSGEQPRTMPSENRADHRVADRFLKFVPQTQTKSTRLDYSVWDEALENSVVSLGPSTRRHMGRPEPIAGSRRVVGHRSAYRLEGSRVRFSELNDDYKAAVSDYRQDLEHVADQVNLTRLSKNEQLAFWLNLHNAALIEQISMQYPAKHPSEMTIDGVQLHDAKIVTVQDTPLSLRDIRENIVYRNWSTPTVIYGFFLGDIGGPMIQNKAFTGAEVNAQLKFSAEEFTNSLRGAHEGSKTLNVSRIYDDVQRFYFPDFETDLVAHLLEHVRSDVADDIKSGKPLKIDRYDRIVADMEGGERPKIARSPVANPTGSGKNINEAALQFRNPLTASSEQYMREVGQKVKVLQRRGLVGTAKVTIEDIETDDKTPEPEPRP